MHQFPKPHFRALRNSWCVLQCNRQRASTPHTIIIAMYVCSPVSCKCCLVYVLVLFSDTNGRKVSSISTILRIDNGNT
ncbi:hypothetical protein GBAR_LOCUS12852 [Geodia barretti]|uniref:Uncharacterized protein n=1 Tax=Geodia barretti TaxID=519541 RepID=A0AA35S2J5_GEOBA|nr:hypothetical protein GBAR_LOCUS12852 [Geodia barretti]